jgi:hypothetical protein
MAIISLRLPFGGAPCPYEWGVISESICDLANALLQDEKWDPLTLSAPTTLPPRKTMDDDIPFGIGRKLIVDIPVDPRGTIDCYIDDTIGLTVDTEEPNTPSRIDHAITLAIHATSRPLHQHETIPRDEMISDQKFEAEGTLEEHKIILGWYFDFRRLIVALPENKFVAWSESIAQMLSTGKSTPHELEKLIGRLGHLSSIIPMVHHFLSRLRDLLFRSQNKRQAALTENCTKDLQLMRELLEIGRE